METAIRVGSIPFYASEPFPYGLSRSSYFNKRESDELVKYGHTLSCLLNGLLAPENEEEAKFIADINNCNESKLYSVRLWRKYLLAIEKRGAFHGFSRSSKNMRTHSSNDAYFEHAG